MLTSCCAIQLFLMHFFCFVRKSEIERDRERYGEIERDRERGERGESERERGE